MSTSIIRVEKYNTRRNQQADNHAICELKYTQQQDAKQRSAQVRVPNH